MSIEEDFEEWWVSLELPKRIRGSLSYNMAKAAWRRCATLQKERITEDIELAPNE